MARYRGAALRAVAGRRVSGGLGNVATEEGVEVSRRRAPKSAEFRRRIRGAQNRLRRWVRKLERQDALSKPDAARIVRLIDADEYLDLVRHHIRLARERHAAEKRKQLRMSDALTGEAAKRLERERALRAAQQRGPRRAEERRLERAVRTGLKD